MAIISRRRFVAGGAVGLVGLAAAGCEIWELTEPEAPVLEDKAAKGPTQDYEFVVRAKKNTTVAGALKQARLRLKIDRSFSFGRLITAINGRNGDWRINVNERWFGVDALTKRVRRGDRIGCWRI